MRILKMLFSKKFKEEYSKKFSLYFTSLIEINERLFEILVVTFKT